MNASSTQTEAEESFCPKYQLAATHKATSVTICLPSGKSQAFLHIWKVVNGILIRKLVYTSNGNSQQDYY